MKRNLSVLVLVVTALVVGVAVQSCAGGSASSNVTITGAGN